MCTQSACIVTVDAQFNVSVSRQMYRSEELVAEASTATESTGRHNLYGTAEFLARIRADPAAVKQC